MNTEFNYGTNHSFKPYPSIQIEIRLDRFVFPSSYFLNNSSKAVVPTTVPSGMADKSIW